MFETHQDGTISVVFGCDFNCLSSVKPGAEVKRFKVCVCGGAALWGRVVAMRFALTCVVKESNVRLVGPLGAHVQLLGMQTVVTADSDKVRRRVRSCRC